MNSAISSGLRLSMTKLEWRFYFYLLQTQKTSQKQIVDAWKWIFICKNQSNSKYFLWTKVAWDLSYSLRMEFSISDHCVLTCIIFHRKFLSLSHNSFCRRLTIITFFMLPFFLFAFFFNALQYTSYVPHTVYNRRGN